LFHFNPSYAFGDEVSTARGTILLEQRFENYWNCIVE